MDPAYDDIVTWFLSLLEEGETKPQVSVWLLTAHSRAMKSSCKCNLCDALHQVTHLFLNGESDKLRYGSDPWIRVAALWHVERFITDMLPPIPSVAMLALLCQIETGRIVRENSLDLPEGARPIPADPPSVKVDPIDVALENIQDVVINNIVKALPQATGESPDTNASNNGDEMPTNSQQRDPLDNPADVEGLQFFKDGAVAALPKDTTYRTVIAHLTQRAEEEERLVKIDERIDAFILEGAYAFNHALKDTYGSMVNHGDAPNAMSFFAELFGGPAEQSPVTLMTVQTGLHTSEQIVWSKVRLPGLEGGHLIPSVTQEDGRFYFVIKGEVKQKDKSKVMELVALTKRYVREHSIYAGKALVLDMPNLNSGESFDIRRHAPTFMEGLDKIEPAELIFSADIEEAIDVNVLTVIKNTELVRRLGLKLKRGNLFFGNPGMGKTLAAANVAKLCEANGWTFWYVKKVHDLVAMYKLAAQYPRSVLFVEDIDQIVPAKDDDEVSEEDKVKFRTLLNTLDGSDGKDNELMVIFTSNKNPSSFDDAFTRASRLDFIIELTPPDAEAATRLIRWYSRGKLAEGTDLTTVGSMLSGQSPATIGEVCTKALLAFARRNGNNALDGKVAIKAEDLEAAARAVLKQVAMTTPATPADAKSGKEKAAEVLSSSIGAAAELIATTLAAATKPANHANGHNGHTTNGNGQHHEDHAG